MQLVAGDGFAGFGRSTMIKLRAILQSFQLVACALLLIENKSLKEVVMLMSYRVALEVLLCDMTLPQTPYHDKWGR